MTNIDRAEAILAARYVTDQMEGDGAANCFDAAAAQALADAGLLAPDLPPVVVDEFDERPHVTITGTHVQDDARLRVNEHGAFQAINAWSDPMNPAEARERAYALLALANHVEESTDD